MRKRKKSFWSHASHRFTADRGFEESPASRGNSKELWRTPNRVHEAAEEDGEGGGVMQDAVGQEMNLQE